jgi:hypothetical protein
MQEWFVTRVVRWSGPPAVVRVQTPADVVVAVPCGLTRHDVLGLARLVLSGREYAELRRKIRPAGSSQLSGASPRRSAVSKRESRQLGNQWLKPVPSRQQRLSPQ